MIEYGIWTGAREYPLPGGTRGQMSMAKSQGFKVVSFVLDPSKMETV